MAVVTEQENATNLISVEKEMTVWEIVPLILMSVHQFTEGGETGQSGQSVNSVEEESRLEAESVTHQRHYMVGISARARRRKVKIATMNPVSQDL